MKAKNVKLSDVQKSIDLVNKERGYQLAVRDFKNVGHWLQFTIKSPSKVPGSCISVSGRNMPCASSHAYGFVIDELFNLCPDMIIETLGKRYDKTTWKWNDYNVGSIMFPCWASELSIL